MFVLEIVSSTLTALGLGLILAALIIRLVYGSWSRTQAVSIEHEGHAYLRWHDHRYRIVEALWSSGVRRKDAAMPEPPAPGEDVGIYFQVRRPHTWSTRAPYRGTRAVAVAGLVLAVTGALLGFLPG